MSDTLYAWSTTPEDNGTADATINWAEGQPPSTANDSARAMMARIKRLVNDMAPTRTSTGTGNAYAVTSESAGSSFRNGEQVTFLPDRSNTAACTLDVGGRGAKAWRPAPGVDFVADNILEGVPVTAYYRSASDEWLSPGTGYYVTNLASGVSLQAITARLPQIGDLVVSYAPTPGPGRIRLTESTQSLLKTAYPELNAYLSGISYPWGSTATHFTLPPAAGYFLRFAATTASVDTGGARAAGSTQADANKAATIPATGLTASTSTSTSTSTTTTITPNPHGHSISPGQGVVADRNARNDEGGSVSAGPNQTFSVGETSLSASSVSTSSSTSTTTIGGSVSLSGASEVRVKNVAYHLDVVASTALSAAQVAVFGFPYQWDTDTAASDPGSGRVRGNNETLASITALYISATDGWGVDLSGIFENFDTGNVINLSKVGAQANRVVFNVSGAPTDNGDYFTISGTVAVSGGSLSSNDQLALEFTRDGVDGVTVPDISGLTEDTTNLDNADYLIEYDASASIHKKVLPKNLGYTSTRTGGVRRSLNDKLGDIINVKDFGAAGDGSTDDTTALVNAIAALPSTGGVIYVPAGVYMVDPDQLTLGNGSNSALSTRNGIALIGEAATPYLSTSGTVIKARGAGTSLLTLAGPVFGLRIENIQFDCNNVCANGWTAYSVCHSAFENVAIINFTTYGLNGNCRSLAAAVSWSSNNIFRNFYIVSQAVIDYGAGILIDGNFANNYDWHRNVFEGGVVQINKGVTNPTYALQFNFTDSNTFIEIDASVTGSGTGYAALFSGTSNALYPQNLFFYGCSLIGGTVVDGTISKNYFVNFTTRDSETIPTDANLIGNTDQGQFFGSHTFSATVTPTTNDAAALGTGALSWSDLFLAAGGVVNFDNGDVTLTHATGVLTLAGAETITSSSANALAVGANGTTNPVLQVNASTASVATGVAITGAAAASRAALSVISSGTDEGMSIDAKGAGTIRLGATSTGAVEFSRNAVPTASDGAALGTTALMWSDLFLASGAVVNWNAGDVTLTHSANTLAFAGASSGYTFDSKIAVGGPIGSDAFQIYGNLRIEGASVPANSYGWLLHNSSATLDYGLNFQHYSGGVQDALIAIGGNAATGNIGVISMLTNSSGAAVERMRITGDGHQIWTPGGTTPVSLSTNGTFTLTPTSDTNFRISYRGSDGTTRVGNIALA